MTVELISGPWAYADLATLPDDGRRYEIIDGVLLVSPSPVPDHQGIVLMLSHTLVRKAPAELRVLTAPLDVVLSDDTVVEPDILVARRDAFGPKNLPSPPVLAVEVLSPSTRLIDLNVKKALYERTGVQSYWVVDPATLQFTAYELEDGRYVTVAAIEGDQEWTAPRPFTVTIVPSQLQY